MIRFGIIGFLIFGIWALFARYYIVCKIMDDCAKQEIGVAEDQKIDAAYLSIYVEDSLLIEQFAPIHYPVGEATPMLSEVNRLMLDSIARLLMDDYSLTINISGLYVPAEQEFDTWTSPGGANYPDLGKARAAAIQEYLVHEGVEADQIELYTIELDTFHTRKSELERSGNVKIDLTYY